jgi:hypothetical protein
VKSHAKVEPDVRYMRSHFRIMLIICLAALGLSLTVIAHAIRGAGDGYQDELGFHNDRRTDSDL